MEELKFGMIGNVDAGKSSCTSVLINGILDDGRGGARQKIMKFPHEIISGRTSSITEHFYKINEEKCIAFVDLAGHDKYLKTTMHGLSGNYIDYGIVFVGANMGISKMTEEHLILCVTLQIPYIIVITKIDLAPKNIYDDTINSIEKIIKKFPQNIIKVINDKNDIINFKNESPIFSVSNKTGFGINLLREYLFNLKPRFNWNLKKEKEICFVITHKYNINGIGLVITGKMISGILKKGDKLLFGPFNGKWINVTCKSIHDNFRNDVDKLASGESGCVAIKGKFDINTKTKIKKGLILINKQNINAIKYFDAEVVILTKHSTTIHKGYQPIINCNNIVQTACVIDIYNNEILRCGNKSKIKFKFLYRPEYVEIGNRFIFRDGKTKGFGKIVEVYE